ncbi:MAG: DnaJ C-terminal domain-containing protein [Spirochaetales bacterium]|jgi:curved DNA-binding protein
MEVKDYYKALGVERTASKDELKKQYRKLARQYHPDVNTTDKNTAAKFREITEAYEVLTDDAKRKKYDDFGADWEQHQNSGQAENFDWSKYASREGGQESASGANWEDLFGGDSDQSDFFSRLFGQDFQGRGGARFARKGQDMSAELPISLEEAYEGGARILSIGDKKIRLTLKPGIWDRQKIKIAGKGGPGPKGGENGDLFITFIIKPHPDYRLEGTNLFKDIPVSVYSAMLGTALKVRTISGNFELKIPPGTKNGTVFRLKGKGFPVYGKPGNQGNLFLKVVLQLPENLTTQEKKLWRELAALRNENVRGEQE